MEYVANKQSKKKNNGKKYEKKVSKLVRMLYPGANVQDDVKLPANITRGERQVDTLLKSSSGEIDFDAKDHRRNLGIKDVADYGFKLKDEGISSGVLVSNSPYAKSAVAAATHFGIKPTHLIDTTDKENPFSIATRALIEGRYVKSLSFGVRHMAIGGNSNVSQDLGRQELVSDDGKRTQSAYNVFEEIWNSGFLIEKIKEYSGGADGYYTYTLPKQEIVMADGTQGVVDEFSFHYEVGTEYLEGKWNIQQAQGLYDAAKNSFQTNQNIKSETLSIEDLSKWPKVDPENLDKSKYGVRIQVVAELPKSGA